MERISTANVYYRAAEVLPQLASLEWIVRSALYVGTWNWRSPLSKFNWEIRADSWLIPFKPICRLPMTDDRER